MPTPTEYQQKADLVQRVLRRASPRRSEEKVQEQVGLLTALSTDDLRREPESWSVFADFLTHLNEGHIRAAEPLPGGDRWKVNSWVKDGIMIGFRLGGVVPMGRTEDGAMFADRPAFPLRPIKKGGNVRIVPISSVRAGAYLEDTAVVMAGAYVNVGARVGRGTLVDSLALVGSCAQVGEDTHISMLAGIGGVLEPPQAFPCIIGDQVVMFGGTEIAEGVRLRNRVVLGMGVRLASGIEVHDLVNGCLVEPIEGVLEIPEAAVVIPGTRPITNNPYARKLGLHKNIAKITKFRDSKTDAKTALEQALR